MANKIKNIKLGNVKYDIYDNTALHQGDAVGSVSSVVGLTGDVTVASIATALATAGYKLTDTDTNTWQAANSSQVGYVPASTANKILRADSNGTLYWGDDSNTTYTLASLMGSGAKGGTTQPIYWDGSAFKNTTYTLGKSVPSNALFTDTNTWKAANTSQEGYVPKLAAASTDTITTQSSEYVLTFKSGTDTTPVWRKLPATAYSDHTYTIPTVNNGTYSVKTLVGSTTTTVSDFTANQSGADDITFVQGNGITLTADATNRKITIATSFSDTDTNTLYYLTLNGSVTGTASTTNLGTIYAPTTAGTSGYYLKSNGSGAPSWLSFPTSLPASDVSGWAKAPTKPSYSYSEISGTPSSLPASDVYSWAKASTKPTYIMNEVANISVSAITSNTSSSCTITGSSNAGKSQTIIYTNSSGSDLTVTVPTTYSTPDGAAIELTCANGGYCEVNYLNVGGTIYARGL